MKKVITTIVLLVVFVVSGCGNSSEVDKKVLMVGHNVKLNKDCFGAISKDVYDKLVNYTSTQNVSAADKMRMTGLLLVMKAGDIAELTETNTGYVKMKMLNGQYAGREVYVFREMVTKINQQEVSALSTQQPKPTNSSDPIPLSSVNKADITEKQRAIYKEWYQQFAQQVSNFKALDNQISDLHRDFLNQKLTSAHKAKLQTLLSSMEKIQTNLQELKTPKVSQPAIDDNIWRMAIDFRSGINDQMVAQNRMIDYVDGKLSFKDADDEVFAALKSAGDFFYQYEARNGEFKRIFD